MAKKRKVLIMGAAGRDFHNFNVLFRDNKSYKVVAFTATQIPNIEARLYPPSLAGSLYPHGIKIHDESELVSLIGSKKVEEVVFSYSDVSHEYVMHKASVVNSAGAGFTLLGAEQTMIKSAKPVISVCAVRTGCGKSQTARKICDTLLEKGKKVVVVRHPMPYGDLEKQACQRFATLGDMKLHNCTIEEMEEFEPHIEKGVIVYAGVDYEKILRAAEKEADVVLWDGGNNDTPFFKPDLEIVVVDPHRAGHEVLYYPGETNFRRADIIVINKIDSAREEDVKIIEGNIKKFNPDAEVVKARSEIIVEDPEKLKGKKVLVVEDGPTLTHGGMKFGAGIIAAKRMGLEIVKPAEYAVGTIKKTYDKYPHMEDILPAMGYGKKQVKDLEDTINSVPCDIVLSATPINLSRVVQVNKPIVRVRYEFGESRLKGLLGNYGF